MDTSFRPFLKNKPLVGIFGNGLSGKGAAHLCEKLHLPYEIIDEQQHSQTPHFKRYGLCVFSPGFSPNHPWRREAQKANIPYVAELDFATSCFDNPIIAVTGTNGKTSVTEVLTQLLRNSDKEVLSVGNNGRVLSDVVADEKLSPNGIYICEVSSFQAQFLKFLHPTYTLWTNFAPDHLNWHGNLKDYFFAKYRLLERTKKTCFCGNSLGKAFRSFEIPSPAASVVFASPAEELNDWLQQFPLCFSQGQCENFALIRTFAQHLKIDEATVCRTLGEFQQPPHRLHCCRRIGEASFWNDSKGTNLHAVRAAVESLKDLPNLWWILGGGGKGEDLDGFIQTLNRYPVQTICLVGETGRELMQKASEFKANVIHAETLPKVFKHLPNNKAFTLVLSPGFTSWDQFKSFEERGELFEKLVRDYVPSSGG
ncbi:MAG: UDP-N-acetylmuramoyl-L-alanine--D-glutamate ligase [Opitutales bacterium]|nr:UDP-N-acetylmuramoyl-L-alanine--D-glutamate ligase [Opitutales bacterium]